MNFIDGSVGFGGHNRSSDVRIIQQTLNGFSQVPYRPLSVDGSLDGTKQDDPTTAAILRFQSAFLRSPDGLVEPFGMTVTRLWPLAYANPTGRPPRKRDLYGEGHFGASRGSRSHDGVDYEAVAGLPVKSPISGRATRVSKPYTSGIDSNALSGLQIEAADGTTCKIWYLAPSAGIVGRLLAAGDVIGTAQTLQNRYPPMRPPLRRVGQMTDHVHVRIHDRRGVKIDPARVIR